MDRKPALILSLLITLLIFGNIYFFSKVEKPDREKIDVDRIIDGDTIVLNSGEIVRLLNINSPERGSQGYEESKEFLSFLINNTIEIEREGTDKYRRTLARIYTPGYLNLEIVESGFASKFLVDKKEIKEFRRAEEEAINSEKGIWNKSTLFGCFTTEVNSEAETILLKNNCETVNIQDWLIKDESRKQYIFSKVAIGEVKIHSFNGTSNKTDIFWDASSEIWNDDRDSVYLFDSEGNLAHYETYGY